MCPHLLCLPLVALSLASVPASVGPIKEVLGANTDYGYTVCRTTVCVYYTESLAFRYRVVPREYL